MKHFAFPTLGLFLLVLFLSSQPLSAQKPIWTASGSIDNDGDGVPDRTLRREGFDDDGDGKADRKVTKEDMNGDGDFNDPGETTTETVPGNAMVEVTFTDDETGVKTTIKGEDTNGNGKFDMKEISTTHGNGKPHSRCTTGCVGSSSSGETVLMGGPLNIHPPCPPW